MMSLGKNALLLATLKAHCEPWLCQNHPIFGLCNCRPQKRGWSPNLNHTPPGDLEGGSGGDLCHCNI